MALHHVLVPTAAQLLADVLVGVASVVCFQLLLVAGVYFLSLFGRLLEHAAPRSDVGRAQLTLRSGAKDVVHLVLRHDVDFGAALLPRFDCRVDVYRFVPLVAIVVGELCLPGLL